MVVYLFTFTIVNRKNKNKKSPLTPKPTRTFENILLGLFIQRKQPANIIPSFLPSPITRCPIQLDYIFLESCVSVIGFGLSIDKDAE
ncbi:hypothetical protein NC651_032695 [Populus alba x Populus x berolinensis]|nr:hypothetical protein NC651_032695 [Populus alba x Populus x berolinensis]